MHRGDLHANCMAGVVSDGLVNLAEAARRLTEAGDKVDRSTLSRYVKQHAADLKPTKMGRETVVNLDLLALHRRGNTKTANSSAFDADIDFGRERAGKTRAERLRIEMELGERQGILTVVREVENAAHAAVGTMRSALSTAAGDTAEALGRELGVEPGLIRPYIRKFERLALDAFVRGLTENKVVRAEDLVQAPDEEEPDGPGEG